MEVLAKQRSDNAILRKSNSWIFYVAVFTIAVEIMALVSGILSRRPIYESFVFTGYQVMAILIPGLAYVELLKVKFCETGTARVLLAYAVGYGSNIAIYYIMFWLGEKQNSQIAVLSALGLQFAVSIFVLIKKKTEYSETQKLFCMVPIFVGILFSIELFTYCGNNMMPPYTDAAHVAMDLVYWIGNSIALKQDYPPMDFRTLREGYGYHFFSSIQIAMVSIATEVDVLIYSICYSYIQAIIVMVGGFYCLLEKQIKKNRNILFLFIIFFLLSGYEDITRTNWSMHIFVSQFGFDYGLGLMMFLLLIINEFFSHEFSYSNFFLLNFMFAILMGVKSPFACIGIVGIGIGCFYELSRRKWGKAIGEGIVILLIFGCIYFWVVNIKSVAGGEVTDTILITQKYWEESVELGEVRSWIMNIPFCPQVLKELLFFISFIFLCHPCLILCAVIYALENYKRKRSVDWTDVAFMAMFLTGMGIGLYLYMADGSQIYFVCATYPVILLWMSRAFGDSEILNSKKCLALCLVLWGGYLTIAHPAWNPMIGYASVGKYNFIKAQHGKYAGDGYISQYEYEILEFIKEHIPEEESILFVNERNKSQDRWLIAGIIAEHKMKTVNREEVTSRSDLEKIIRSDYDYDFFVVSNDLLAIDDNVVFSNEGWAIVKVGHFHDKN